MSSGLFFRTRSRTMFGTERSLMRLILKQLTGSWVCIDMSTQAEKQQECMRMWCTHSHTHNVPLRCWQINFLSKLWNLFNGSEPRGFQLNQLVPLQPCKVVMKTIHYKFTVSWYYHPYCNGNKNQRPHPLLWWCITVIQMQQNCYHLAQL